jgi:hypothetical protein
MKALILAAALLLTPPVDEAPTITLDQTAPRLGDYVTFTVTYPHKLERREKEHYNGGELSIQIICYQDGVMVDGNAGYYEQAFQLGLDGSAWQSGAASCQADLYYWSYPHHQQVFNLLASTTFEAADRL